MMKKKIGYLAFYSYLTAVTVTVASDIKKINLRILKFGSIFY